MRETANRCTRALFLRYNRLCYPFMLDTPMGHTEAALIKAIAHIRLREANKGKLSALDALWVEYKALCQTYVTHFCTVAKPDKYAETVYDSPLSARWQRVAIGQAAGIAQSWRTNRRAAAEAYLAKLARWTALPDDKRA